MRLRIKSSAIRHRNRPSGERPGANAENKPVVSNERLPVARPNHPACPKCGSMGSTRIRRRGLFMRYVAPVLGLFPWECGSCRTIFVSRARGNMVKLHGTINIAAWNRERRDQRRKPS
jgi:hypothetical protein